MARGCNPPYCGGKYDKNCSTGQQLSLSQPCGRTDLYNLIIVSNLLDKGSQYQSYLFVRDVFPVAQAQDLVYDVKALYRTRVCLKVEVLDAGSA
jgi:hypothetical protein